MNPKHQFVASHISIQSLYTSTGSLRKLIVVWNRSEHTRQLIKAEFRDLSLKSEAHK